MSHLICVLQYWFKINGTGGIPVALLFKNHFTIQRVLSLLDKFKVTSEHVLIIGHCPLM